MQLKNKRKMRKKNKALYETVKVKDFIFFIYSRDENREFKKKTVYNLKKEYEQFMIEVDSEEDRPKYTLNCGEALREPYLFPKFQEYRLYVKQIDTTGYISLFSSFLTYAYHNHGKLTLKEFNELSLKYLYNNHLKNRR